MPLWDKRVRQTEQQRQNDGLSTTTVLSAAMLSAALTARAEHAHALAATQDHQHNDTQDNPSTPHATAPKSNAGHAADGHAALDVDAQNAVGADAALQDHWHKVGAAASGDAGASVHHDGGPGIAADATAEHTTHDTGAPGDQHSQDHTQNHAQDHSQDHSAALAPLSHGGVTDTADHGAAGMLALSTNWVSDFTASLNDTLSHTLSTVQTTLDATTAQVGGIMHTVTGALGDTLGHLGIGTMATHVADSVTGLLGNVANHTTDMLTHLVDNTPALTGLNQTGLHSVDLHGIGLHGVDLGGHDLGGHAMEVLPQALDMHAIEVPAIGFMGQSYVDAADVHDAATSPLGAALHGFM
ncbi:MAG TPA: hypothetical protein VL402_10340 [Xanthobacteraceae bacterium]|jgi:hypothetical protein|nr:hypothetical protein [Xanthobacteraceae bacterium]